MWRVDWGDCTGFGTGTEYNNREYNSRHVSNLLRGRTSASLDAMTLSANRRWTEKMISTKTQNNTERNLPEVFPA